MKIRLIGGFLYLALWAFVFSFMAKGLCLHPVIGYLGFALFLIASTMMTSPNKETDKPTKPK